MDTPKNSDREEIGKVILGTLLAAIIIVPVYKIIFSSDEEPENSSKSSIVQTSEYIPPSDTLESTSPMSESTYKTRIVSQGTEISKAGNYLIQSARLCREGMTQSEYDECVEVLNQASMAFTNVSYVFKGQKNPPVEYAEFNKNMIQILDGMILATDNIFHAMGFEDFETADKERKNLGNLSEQMEQEFTKIGL